MLDALVHLWSPLFMMRAAIATAALPRPEEAPRVHISGPDPDRLLAVGGAMLSGFGVLSHDLGLGGHLARQVSHSTQRGVIIDLASRSELTLHDVKRLLSDRDLSQYDAVVLAVGVTDALKRTPPRMWRRSLSTLISYFQSQLPAGSHVFVVGVQPVRLIMTLDNLVGLFAELHGAALNRETTRFCAETEGATFIPFCPDPDRSPRYRSSSMYERWAALVSPEVARVLINIHPLDEAKARS